VKPTDPVACGLSTPSNIHRSEPVPPGVCSAAQPTAGAGTALAGVFFVQLPSPSGVGALAVAAWKTV
jgi:hypothetical protein